MTPMKKIFTLTAILTAAACSSGGVKKADIPSTTNPTDAISKLETDINNGQTNNYDVLASQEFNQSKEHLQNAKEKLQKNKDREDVLDELRYSQAYYDRAQQLSNERRSKVEGVITARDAATTAGAGKLPQLSNRWSDADKDAKKLSEKSGSVSTEDYSKVQNEYYDLELAALLANNLGTAKSQIDAADHDNAKKYAPKTFKAAQIDYQNAVNTLTANRKNSSAYAAPVQQVNSDAETLTSLMAMEKTSKNFDEDAGLKIIAQNKRINSLDEKLTDEQKANSQMAQNISAQKDALAATQTQLQDADAKVRMQAAIENARKELSNQDAEVFQQGDKLVVRLKTMNFPTGKAVIPDHSKEVLGKVLEISNNLKASNFDIQGHTDSVGGTEKNQELSEARAKTVADYFETKGIESAKITSEGFGFSKPISSNKTKVGRAQNRRVDIIITPASQSM